MVRYELMVNVSMHPVRQKSGSTGAGVLWRTLEKAPNARALTAMRTEITRFLSLVPHVVHHGRRRVQTQRPTTWLTSENALVRLAAS